LVEDLKDNQEDPEDMDEEYEELELNEEEAPFLKGQTTKAGMCLDPIKISNIPDGSL
jgi:ATP-dependent RNA helicase DHX8/PRP22